MSGLYIYNIVSLIISILNILILIRVLLSWIAPNSSNGFTDLVYGITEPILKPFRELIPLRNMRIDISPLLAYMFFRILQRLLGMLIF